MYKTTILIFTSIVLSTTCNTPTPKFSIPFPFDQQKWQQDSLACNGYRQSIIDSIMAHKDYFLYKTNIDTFLRYFGGYYATEQFGDTQHYTYWVEPGYHCRADLENPNQYRIAIENETFWAVVARKKDNIVQEIALGIP